MSVISSNIIPPLVTLLPDHRRMVTIPEQPSPPRAPAPRRPLEGVKD